MKNSNNKNVITILGAGPGLGFYIPGLIVHNQLQARGYYADFVAFENLLLREKQKLIPEARLAFHRNFAAALMGQKLTKDIRSNLDEENVIQTISAWITEGRRRFIVFSGFWIPIVEKYLNSIDFTADVSIDLCHVDAAPSTSWKLYNSDHSCYHHVWFANWEEKNVSYRLDVSSVDNAPVPFSERTDRFIIHGGGWGMGTYKEQISALEKMQLKLDVIIYEEKDFEGINTNNRYFMIDPEWNHWEINNNGSYQFPPFGRIHENLEVEFKNNIEFPEVYSLIRYSKAIISKPGGSTLIDSVSSATPIILLDPFGEYEKKNSLLWEYLGFGIPYQKWVDSGCSIKILEELHVNILNARIKIPNYIDRYNYAAANNS